MRLAVRRVRRVLATGLAVATFHAGCLVIALPLIVACRLSSRSEELRRRRVQQVLHRSLRCFIGLLRTLGLANWNESGVAQLNERRGVLIVANHPTLLDVLYLIAHMRSLDCIVKRDLWRNRWLRGCVAAAGYVANDEGGGVIETCAERLRSGRNVLVFPEGTRSPPDGLRRFQRGAARIALESGADILPILITCSPPLLAKGTKWYDVPARTPRFTFRVGHALSPARWTRRGTAKPTAVRELTAALQTYFRRELGHDQRA